MKGADSAVSETRTTAAAACASASRWRRQYQSNQRHLHPRHSPSRRGSNGGLSPAGSGSFELTAPEDDDSPLRWDSTTFTSSLECRRKLQQARSYPGSASMSKTSPNRSCTTASGGAVSHDSDPSEYGSDPLDALISSTSCTRPSRARVPRHSRLMDPITLMHAIHHSHTPRSTVSDLSSTRGVSIDKELAY